MIYAVLGMHKSGTTVLAQTIHASGIDMGTFDESSTYDQGNHCEREKTQRLNKRLLACGNAHSLTVVQTVSLQDALPTLLGEMAEAIRKIDEQHESWGFKDPRSCLTLEVWTEQLSEFKVIGIYRHPLEVWHHYIHSRNPLTRLAAWRGVGGP